MNGLRRLGLLLGLCIAAVAAGCSFPAVMYFLMPEAKEPAEYKRLASDDKKREIKVLLWTYMGLDTRMEFTQVDRQLTELLARQIRKMSEENDEKLTFISPRKVEEYKNEHPNWKTLDPDQVGRFFHADYVISLEIDQFGLYAPNAHEMLLQGKSHMLISLVDVKQPDESLPSREFTYIYPGEQGALDNFSMPIAQFRQIYLEKLARRLTYWFVNHPKHDRVMMMDL